MLPIFLEASMQIRDRSRAENGSESGQQRNGIRTI
jgi:hypothetical protein